VSRVPFVRCVRTIRALALLAVVLSLVPTPAAAADPPAQAGNPYVFGISTHAWWLDPEVYGDQLLAAIDDLGVTTVRLSIDWRRFEPTQGQYDWTLYDTVLGELAARHLVIVATFNTIPGWASVDQASCDDQATEVQTCQLRADMRGAFEAAMRAAVTRYAWIQYWEFWNEPEMWRYLGEDGTVYLRNLRAFYDIAHAINPEVVVAAQTLVGVEYMEYIYNLSERDYGDGNEPWDAISIHPYVWDYTWEQWGRPFELNYDRILGLRHLQVVRNDAHEKLWITEYGWNNGVENQATNLPNAFNWLKRQSFVEFAHLHMLHDWNENPIDFFGLMSISPDQYGVARLTPDTVFIPKQPYYDAFKSYPRGELPAAPTDPAVLAFPQTGHSVSGRFRTAWEQRGGLPILGYPLSRPYPRQQADGSWLLVQDFERARLEFHPQYLGGWGEVLGTLAGNLLTASRRAEAPFVPLPSCPVLPERDCFVATSHTLGGGFRAFWHAHGGLAAFGYPLSEEFAERNPDTGQVYVVQYFERARFEWHPEHAGTAYEVLLGRLIGNELEAAGWAWPPPGSRLPTAREFQ
jgi:hypothetical protein